MGEVVISVITIVLVFVLLCRLNGAEDAIENLKMRVYELEGKLEEYIEEGK